MVDLTFEAEAAMIDGFVDGLEGRPCKDGQHSFYHNGYTAGEKERLERMESE